MPAPLPVSDSNSRNEPRSSDLQIALRRIEDVGTRHDAQLRDVATAIREDRQDNAVIIGKLIELSESFNRQNTWRTVAIVAFLVFAALTLAGYPTHIEIPGIGVSSAGQ